MVVVGNVGRLRDAEISRFHVASQPLEIIRKFQKSFALLEIGYRKGDHPHIVGSIAIAICQVLYVLHLALPFAAGGILAGSSHLDE